jgi:hypothetical protein
LVLIKEITELPKHQQSIIQEMIKKGVTTKRTFFDRLNDEILVYPDKKLQESVAEIIYSFSNKEQVPVRPDEEYTEPNVTDDFKEESLTALRNPALLYEIVNEVKKEGVVGEEVNIIGLATVINTRNVKNVKPESMNAVVSGKPGYGKDNLLDTVLKVIVSTKDLVETSGTTPKTLDYWTLTDDPKWTGWNWDGKVLKITDPSEETIKSDSVRTFASGKQHSETIIDQKNVTLNITGKPAFFMTSFKSSIDIEGERRWEIFRVDQSDELTKEVLKRKGKNRANNTINSEINEHLRYGLQHMIKPCSVVIPFANDIVENFPSKIDNSRTKIELLFDYVSSVANLHQYQREKDKDGNIIATWFDYDIAALIFNVLKGETGKSLSVKEQELVDYLSKQSYAKTTGEIQSEAGISQKWIDRHKDDLIERKIVKTDLVPRLRGSTQSLVTGYYFNEEQFVPLQYSATIKTRKSHDTDTIQTTGHMIDTDDTDTFKEIVERIKKDREELKLNNDSLKPMSESSFSSESICCDGVCVVSESKEETGEQGEKEGEVFEI